MAIAKLSIDIEARLANFDRDLANMSGKLDAFSSKITSAFKGVGLAAAGLAGVGSFAILKGNIEDAISGMADLKDAAERTGASVENLSALKGVAKIGGRDFAEVEGAIIRLNKALHGTDDESKGAGKALAAIGVDLQKLRDMDPAQAMLELAKAQEKFADGGGKSAAMMALLGKSGTQMIPFLHDLAEQSRLVGKVTGEQARAADEYDKNVKRLNASWSALSRQLAAAVVGPAKDVTDWMVKAQKEGGALQAVLIGIGMAANKSIGVEINPLKRAEAGSTEAFNRVASLRKAIGETQDEIDRNIGGLLGKAVAKLRLSGLQDDLKNAERELRSSTRRLKRLATEAVDADKPKDMSLNGQTFGGLGSDGVSGKRADEAASLISRLNEQIGVQHAALQLADKQSAAEKEAIEIMVKLRDGTLQATDAQKQMLAARLESLVAGDKEVASHQAYLKALDDQSEVNRKGYNEMQAAIRAAQESAKTYGLSEVQLSALAEARLTDAIPIARQNGAGAEQIAYLEEELALRRRLTSAIDDLDVKRTLAGTPTGQASAQHARIEELRRQMNDGKISETDYDEAVNALVGKTVDALTTMDEFAKSAAHNMQSALADFFINPSKDGIKGLASSFSTTMQRMIAEAGSAQLMKNLFGNMGQASGGQAASWGWLGQAASWVGSFFADGGVMTNRGPLPLRKYAGGGIARSPQLAMFGEGSTPEAYVPLPDGRAIPVQVRGNNGITISQNITVNAGANSDTAQIKRSVAAGSRMALGALRDAGRYS